MSTDRDNSQDEWMRDISSKMGSVLANQVAQGDDIKEIKSQTIKTNGRVGSLERWRAYIVGSITVIVTLIGWWIILHKS